MKFINNNFSEQYFVMSSLDKQLIEASEKGDLTKVKQLIENGADIHSDYEYSLRKSVHYGYFEIVKYLIENGADQKILFENYINKTWNDKQIAELFLGDKYGNPELRATDELCSESFELPKKGDWYVLWKDNSITIFQNVHLASVESELIIYLNLHHNLLNLLQ